VVRAGFTQSTLAAAAQRRFSAFISAKLDGIREAGA